MRALFATLLDLIFPPRADELVVRALTEETVCDLVCVMNHADIQTLLAYRNPKVRALIWQLKYRGDRRAAELLGSALRAYLKESETGGLIIIPIPLSATRLRERGFNQVSVVAKAACRGLASCRVEEGVLVRTEHRDRQTTLSRRQRIENLRDAFAVRDCAPLAGQNLMLLDDVTTTGATLHEAEKALLACAPNSIVKIALAH